MPTKVLTAVIASAPPLLAGARQLGDRGDVGRELGDQRGARERAQQRRACFSSRRGFAQ